MSTYIPKEPLEKSPIWKLANEIAESVYGILSELPDEEKWHTDSDMRGSATDVLYYVSQALGNGSPGGSEYEWGNARKYASSLKGIYRFAGKQKMFELDPAVMVKLNDLISMVDKELENAHKLSDDVNEEDLERWRKKYKIWKEISS